MVTRRPSPSKLLAVAESTTVADELIQMRGVVKTFKNAAGEFTVLHGIDLTINRGDFVAIVGKSGSGKSTLLNMITGIDHPSSGQVVIGGTDIYKMTESQRSLWRGKNLGIVFQFFQLLPMLTLLENVMLPAYPLGEKRSHLKGKALHGLNELNLSSKAASKVEWLSGGEAQRVSIVRALINDPHIIIADEPTAHLDTRLSYRFMEIIEQFKAQGKTVIITSHDPLVYDAAIVDQVVNLRDGKLEDKPA